MFCSVMPIHCSCLFVFTVVPLVPVLIPMIIDVAGGTDVDSDLIIYRRMNETESVVGK